jgi:hypothetical protein
MSWVGLLAVAFVAGAAGSLAAPAVSLAGPAAPAAASVLKIQYVTGVSARSSTDKTVIVSCPKETKVIDAGGLLADGSGEVTLDDVFPDPNLNFVNATGLENDDFNGGWVVFAAATCAAPLPGLEWINAQTASDSRSTKTLTVACSPGRTVLGNGYAITGGDGEVFVDEAVPNGGPGAPATQVSLIGVEGDPYAADWDLEGFVICADPLPGQQVRSATTEPANLDASVYAYAHCDPGQVVTGSSAELHNGTGSVVLTDDSSLSGAGFARGDLSDYYDTDWWLTTYVFCADA